MEYVAYSRAGKRFAVESTLTNAEAQAVLAEKEGASGFEKKLAKPSTRLSPKMVAWLHICAIRAITTREDVTVSESFPQTFAMLEKVRDDGLKKFPKVRLQIDGQLVQLAMSRKGTVNVTDGARYGHNKYFGAMQPGGGALREGKDITEDVRTLLRAVELNAADAVRRYSTGQCCFCRLELDTRESRTAGYGPTCAKNHGLPWGHIDPSLEILPK